MMRQDPPQTRAAGGFTLIELLVVITIIALLIALMLPALQNVREATRRTLCMSAQRQVVVGVAVFGHDFAGRIPLGYGGFDTPQYNYAFYDRGFEQLGLIYMQGYVTIKEAWTCPSQTSSVSFDFNQSNHWPPGQPSNRITRSHFGTRPARDVSDPANPKGQWNIWRNPDIMSWPNPPRVNTLDGSAPIIADLHTRQWQVDRTHVTGVNVGHLDGSVFWKDRAPLDAHLAILPSPFSSAKPIKTAVYSIWRAFEERP